MKRIAALFVACFFAFATLALAQGSGMSGDRPVQQPILKKEPPVDTTRQPSQYQTAPDQTTTDKMDKKRTAKHPKKKRTTHKKSTSTTTPQ